jgi:hypothetical protein
MRTARTSPNIHNSAAPATRPLQILVGTQPESGSAGVGVNDCGVPAVHVVGSSPAQLVCEKDRPAIEDLQAACIGPFGYGERALSSMYPVPVIATGAYDLDEAAAVGEAAARLGWLRVSCGTCRAIVVVTL